MRIVAIIAFFVVCGALLASASESSDGDAEVKSSLLSLEDFQKKPVSRLISCFVFLSELLIASIDEGVEKLSVLQRFRM